MVASNTDLELLRQLRELSQQMGQVTANLENIREDFLTAENLSRNYRDEIHGKVNNLAERMGKVEDMASSVKVTLDKTIMPMVDNQKNISSRLVGFFVGVGTVVLFVGGAFFAGWENILKLFTK